MNAAELANLIFAVVGAGGTLAAAFMWVGGQKAKQSTQDARIAALETKLAAHDEVRELVTRLDERLGNMTEELRRQPQVIALCVGEAIKAALRYNQAQAASR